MKKYVPPIVHIQVIELEMSFASGSAIVSPLGYDNTPLEESWEQESITHEIEW